MTINGAIEWVGRAIDLAGVAVIAGGILLSAVMYVAGVWKPRDREFAYRNVRQMVGRSVLLGLELLVGADIIRTVAVTPSLISLAVLAGIVAIRSFLSTTLEMEINGRWPWQHEVPKRAPESAPLESRSAPDRAPGHPAGDTPSAAGRPHS